MRAVSPVTVAVGLVLGLGGAALWAGGPTGEPAAPSPAPSPERDTPLRVAITIDDLPWVGPLPEGDTAAIQALDRIAAVLRVHGAPATGFVVCGHAAGEEAALRDWAAWGNALGNHSWSHRDLNATPAGDWVDDVRRCDRYLEGYGSAYAPFFRFPMLHQGPTREKRDRVAAALGRMGLGTAHVSVDNSGWLLARADARALAAHDAVGRHEIARAFVDHIVAALGHADRVAHRKAGRRVPQVLLLHANTLVDRNLDALLLALSDRGVEFVTLEEALSDPVYARPDGYAGPKGLSWLYRMEPASPGDARWDDERAEAIRARFPEPTAGQEAATEDGDGAADGGDTAPGARAFLAVRTPEGFGPVFARAAASPRMRSLLVMHAGELVAEAYFNGAGPETPANLKSVTKSLTSALVGVALREGSIRSVDDPIGTYLPEVAREHPEKASITIRELLTMASGLRPIDYGTVQESPDWVEAVLDRPLDEEARGTFVYDTPVLQLLSAVLRRATGEPLRRLAKEELLGPLGGDVEAWRVDAGGLELGGNDAYLTPRALLRLGELYRRGGRWGGRAVLPPAFVRASTRVQIVPSSPTVNHGTLDVRGYGYLWWVLDLAGETAYAALGHGGQILLVAPRRDLVVVMTSRWPSESSVRHYRHLTRLLLDDVLPRFPKREAVGGA